MFRQQWLDIGRLRHHLAHHRRWGQLDNHQYWSDNQYLSGKSAQRHQWGSGYQLNRFIEHQQWGNGMAPGNRNAPQFPGLGHCRQWQGVCRRRQWAGYALFGRGHYLGTCDTTLWPGCLAVTQYFQFRCGLCGGFERQCTKKQRRGQYVVRLQQRFGPHPYIRVADEY